ncbi:helix-turn-helix domain-containing protein [Pseudoclavibacter helvolus]|uniref:helix-turn-helix domain-containing protein n=1 Tax=Pseudoclavibacter helvolus TaxID=255205 RepID=UPI003C78C8C8
MHTWAQLPLVEGAHRVTVTRLRLFARVAVQQLVLGEGRLVVRRMRDSRLTSRVTVLLDGGGFTATGDDEAQVRVEPGGGILHSEETPLELDITEPATVVSLVGLVGDDGRQESAMPASGVLQLKPSPLISGVSGFGLALLADRKPGTNHDSLALERMARVMVREVLLHARGASQIPERPGTYERAVQLIQRDATRADCTAASLAAELNVSLRNLERSFQQRGGTVRRAVRDARILHAIDLLRDPSRAGLTVSQIASFAGFSNGSALARAMAASGRQTPRSYRQG